MSSLPDVILDRIQIVSLPSSGPLAGVQGRQAIRSLRSSFQASGASCARDAVLDVVCQDCSSRSPDGYSGGVGYDDLFWERLSADMFRRIDEVRAGTGLSGLKEAIEDFRSKGPSPQEYVSGDKMVEAIRNTSRGYRF